MKVGGGALFFSTDPKCLCSRIQSTSVNAAVKHNFSRWVAGRGTLKDQNGSLDLQKQYQNTETNLLKSWGLEEC